MSQYVALARKWRSSSLQDVFGQNTAVTIITNALDRGILHHAYLFTGKHGIGKTSLARILAKCFNCFEGVSANPCNVCNNCLSIDASNCADVVEIDAASKTKVEETRELLDTIVYKPICSRFKVYIIDEAHMLSLHSFNALLKTLEEPPSHVKFILATTEYNKIPPTVLSRCLRLNLPPISDQDLCARMNYILRQENINFTDAALAIIAKHADGSMREALTILEQAICYGNNIVNEEVCYTMLGLVDKNILITLLVAVATQNKEQVFNMFGILRNKGFEPGIILHELIDVLHGILLAREFDKADAFGIKLDASSEELNIYYQIVIQAIKDLPYLPTRWHAVEMAILRMLSFVPAKLHVDTVATTELPKPTLIKESKSLTSTKPAAEPASIITAVPAPVAAFDWYEVLSKLNLQGITKLVADSCQLQNYTDDVLHLAIAPEHSLLIKDKRHAERLQEALSKYLGRFTAVIINTTTNNNIQTPMKHMQQQKQQAESDNLNIMNKDSKVQLILEGLNAKVEKFTLSNDMLAKVGE